MRDVVPTRLVDTYNAILPVEKSQLPWLTSRVGRYPFDSYGALVPIAGKRVGIILSGGNVDSRVVAKLLA